MKLSPLIRGMLSLAHLAAVIAAANAAEKRPAMCRWAIVSSDPEAAVLADLLTAKLSQWPDVELVERERLALATRELELASCAAPGAIPQRLKLGQTLGADALALLSWKKAGTTPFLELVISDCRCGARLRVEYLRYSPEWLPALTEECATIVAATRRNYAGGIKLVLGVTQFLSRNLLHNYDHLQSAYASLLSTALNALPGVAVIEIEEARALARELDVAGQNLQDRLVPVVVEGEFEVSAAQPGADPTVRLTVRASDGQRERLRWERGGLSLMEAVRLLSDQLPRELLAETLQPGTALASREAQVKILGQRAEAFGELGSWPHSTALREALLLLQPDADEQRIALVREYQAPFDPFRNLGQDEVTRARTPEAKAQALATHALVRMNVWRTCARHLEFLMRRRRIQFEVAWEFCRRQTWMLRNSFYRPIPWESLDQECAELDTERRAFVRHVLPLMLALDRTPRRHPDRWSYYRSWDVELFQAVDSPFPAGRPSDFATRAAHDDLQLASELAKRVTTGAPVASGGLCNWLQSRAWHAARAGPDPEYFALFEELKRSPHPSRAVYGRLGELQYRWALSGGQVGGWTDDLPALRADLLELQPEALFAYPEDPDNAVIRCLNGILKDLDARISRRQSELARIEAASKPRPAVPARANDNPARPATICFEPVPLRVQPRSTDTSAAAPAPLITEILNCDDRFDAVWNRRTLFWHRTPGVLEVVVDDAEAEFQEAVWDGQCVWAGTKHKGLFVVDPSGNVVARVDDTQALPPADQGLKLYALAPGKICAVGSFGPHARAWCAIVQREGDAVRVQKFHEATRVVMAQTLTDDVPVEDTHLAFCPTFIHQLKELPSGQLPPLLVGREVRPHPSKTYAYPLQIDLATLVVSVRPFPALAEGRQDFVFLDNGEVLSSNGAHGAPPGKDFVSEVGKRYADEQVRRGLKRPTSRYLSFTQISRFQPCVFRYAGKVYVPDTVWVRVDPVTLESDSLYPSHRLPRDAYLRSGVSAHYGIVVWDRAGRVFCRGRVEEAQTP